MVVYVKNDRTAKRLNSNNHSPIYGMESRKCYNRGAVETQ